MKDIDLYSQILGIQSPWQVHNVELDRAAEKVSVYVEQEPGSTLTCPKCDAACPGYNKRRRQWRHLDTCQYKILLICDLPRIRSPEYGVVTVHVPWGEPGSGFTALFEALVIDWLKEASIQAVCRQLKLGWNVISGIMQSAVIRGLERRKSQSPKRIAVDETSFRKRHDYVTVVSAHDTGTVLHVSFGRKKEDLIEYYNTLSGEQKKSIKAVTMDMAPFYINSTLQHILGALDKIAFDIFHIAKLLGEAVDKVRRQEHKVLQASGRKDLKGTNHAWLTNRSSMSINQLFWFKDLRENSLQTARAWTIKNHLCGILNAFVLKPNNGLAEGINGRIEMIKVRTRGLRDKERFRAAIYCFCNRLKSSPFRRIAFF